jgi:quinol monooxygenase YgiN
MRPRIVSEDRPEDHLRGPGFCAMRADVLARPAGTMSFGSYHRMLNQTHHLALWEFQVKPECTSAFEQTYGPDGAWAQLFRQSLDYLGTKLLRDLNHPGRYLTIDQWTSRESFHRFKKDKQAAYTALDKQCENLTEKEIFLGDFEPVALRSNT